MTAPTWHEMANSCSSSIKASTNFDEFIIYFFIWLLPSERPGADGKVPRYRVLQEIPPKQAFSPERRSKTSWHVNVFETLKESRGQTRRTDTDTDATINSPAFRPPATRPPATSHERCLPKPAPTSMNKGRTILHYLLVLVGTCTRYSCTGVLTVLYLSSDATTKFYPFQDLDTSKEENLFVIN